MDLNSEVKDVDRKINSLQDSVSALEKKMDEKFGINRDSAPEIKKDVSDVVYDVLGQYLFDLIVFITLIFSEALNTDGTPVVSTTNYIGTSRITDTSEGNYMNTKKLSRMRCSFYLENPDRLDGYILSPAVYDSFGSLNSISTMANLRSYFGLRFISGKIYVAVKQAGKSEALTDTRLTLTGTGATDTYELEIRHYINFSDIYVNKSLIGSFATDMVGVFTTTKTYLPLLSPAKSTNGSAVGIVIENYQFIQDK